jgi:hypothetical protein
MACIRKHRRSRYWIGCLTLPNGQFGDYTLGTAGDSVPFPYIPVQAQTGIWLSGAAGPKLHMGERTGTKANALRPTPHLPLVALFAHLSTYLSTYYTFPALCVPPLRGLAGASKNRPNKFS